MFLQRVLNDCVYVRPVQFVKGARPPHATYVKIPMQSVGVVSLKTEQIQNSAAMPGH